MCMSVRAGQGCQEGVSCRFRRRVGSRSLPSPSAVDPRVTGQRSVSRHAPRRAHDPGHRPDVSGMLTEILVGVLVVTVALLVVADSSRTKSDSSQGHADGSAHDARPRIAGDTRGGRTGTFLREPAGTAIPDAVHDADPARRPESISPPVGGYQHSRTGAPAAPSGARGELKNRHVRSRLLLLVTIPAVAVAVIAFCVGGLTDILQGTRIHSPSSSARDGAILSALAIGVVMIVVLVLAAWFTIVTARSVLQPLYRLRVRALEAVGGRRPDAARRVSENDGEDAPSDRESVDVDSPDEIGDVARAFKAMRGELLRMAANEAALRGKLDAMFVNLSNRSQSLVERQIRLIESLEQFRAGQGPAGPPVQDEPHRYPHAPELAEPARPGRSRAIQRLEPADGAGERHQGRGVRGRGIRTCLAAPRSRISPCPDLSSMTRCTCSPS